MNFGFQLAKPAESDIGIAVRMWHSNRSSWRVDRTSLDQRIDSQIAHVDLPDSFRTTESKGVDFVREITYHVKGWSPYPNLRYMQRYEEPVKHCEECAKVGYHSLYFMLPWMRQCPVHKTELTKTCRQCRKKWPSRSNVNDRKCNTCTIRVSKTDLISRGAYDIAPYERSFAPLDRLFKTALRPKSYRRKHLGPRWTARADVSAKLLSIPSSLASLNRLDQAERAELTSTGVPMFDCHHFTFEFERDAEYDPYRFSRRERMAMFRVRKNVLRRAQIAISSLRTRAHRICRCEEVATFHFTPCLYCQMQLVLLGSELSEEVSSYTTVFNYDTQSLRNIRIDDPGIVRGVSLDDQAPRHCIPIWVSMIIYHVDLWMLFRQIAMQVSFYTSAENTRTSSVTLLQDEHAALQQKVCPLAYCHIYAEKGIGHLIFPKAYLEKNLAFSPDLLYLTSL